MVLLPTASSTNTLLGSSVEWTTDSTVILLAYEEQSKNYIRNIDFRSIYQCCAWIRSEPDLISNNLRQILALNNRFESDNFT